ncbi:type VII secretion system-associated protein [Nocardia veterana]|uniref:Type VII secretion system-associated protein n=1 Tax=Nocardia veterana TaxID=132249 RepID=A0A7X6LXD9_9NOCA|nr:type VII secretion system-associated protein [Nocardia veterana]NKY85690.1 type VII secretion system-associated protein [Nocardia veterana]
MTTDQPDRQKRWLVLTAPGWGTDEATQQELPPEAIIGGWQIDEDGRSGPFEPNLAYLPADESWPSDPLDAILRQAAADPSQSIDKRNLIRDFIATLWNSVVDIGCDADGRPLLCTSEDVPCVLITTAAVHRQGVEVDRWRPLVGDRIADAVPAGVEVLINPNSPASCRLTVAALRPPAPRV